MVPLPLPRVSGLEKALGSHKLLEGSRWFSCINCGLATVGKEVVKVLTFPAECEKLEAPS